MVNLVGKIFEKRPERWGHRGDPYLWGDLEKHFLMIPLPYSEEEFIKEMNRIFEELTGHKLESNDSIYISSYSHGGMSSGMISQEFWYKTALPILIKRLQNENKHDDADAKIDT